jgi:hypothetical protein
MWRGCCVRRLGQINGLAHPIETLNMHNDARTKDHRLEPECRCLCVSDMKNGISARAESASFDKAVCQTAARI